MIKFLYFWGFMAGTLLAAVTLLVFVYRLLDGVFLVGTIRRELALIGIASLMQAALVDFGLAADDGESGGMLAAALLPFALICPWIVWRVGHHRRIDALTPSLVPAMQLACWAFAVFLRRLYGPATG